MKINYTINEGTQRILFTCLLTINNRQVVLSYEQHKGYLKTELLDENLGDNPTDFEDVFLYPVSAFLPPPPASVNKPQVPHKIYQEIIDSNYFKVGKWHELQWYELNKLVSSHKAQSKALFESLVREEQLTKRYIAAEKFISNIKWYERIFNFKKISKFLMSRSKEYKF